MFVKKKILIVEDSNLIRFKIKSIFEEFEIEVLELNNAEDLFNFSKIYQNVDLIILDINLPYMDGLTALKKIQVDKTLASIPVIMLTGRSDRLTVQEALVSGAVNYIKKPFTDEELFERVTHVLGSLSPIENNLVNLSDEELKNQIHDEVERSKRGKYPVSFIKIHTLKDTENYSNMDNIITLNDEIKKILRQVDMSFISSKKDILLILPFTDKEGVARVVEKINNLKMNNETEKLKQTVITFPDESINEGELVNCLK